MIHFPSASLLFIDLKSFGLWLHLAMIYGPRVDVARPNSFSENWNNVDVHVCVRYMCPTNIHVLQMLYNNIISLCMSTSIFTYIYVHTYVYKAYTSTVMSDLLEFDSVVGKLGCSSLLNPC